MTETAENLLHRLRHAGTREDWDTFVKFYGPLLEVWAKRLLHADQAADLVQDVLVIVMEKLHTFRGGNERCFLAWLRQVMMNRLRDQARRDAIRPGNVDTVCLDNYMGKDDSAEGFAAADRGFLVRKALQIMQSDFEPTTWRACWETVTTDRSAAEVADELGVSVDVVYSASYRVIRRLRRELLGTWQ